MGARSFSTIPYRENGAPSRRYRLVCGSCGVGGVLGKQDFGQRQADQLVPQKFEAKGWSVGRRAEDDRCPACVNREAEAKRRKLHVVEKEGAEAMPSLEKIQAFALGGEVSSRAEPPPEMTRDHRRIIFAKLQDIYVDESSGYSAGWTDDRVAKDLGVPRAWVSKVRDENFGPDTSAEMVAALADARACIEAADELRKEMDRLVTRGAEILKRVDAIERTVKRIETAIR